MDCSFLPSLNSTLLLFTGLLFPFDVTSISPNLNSTISLFTGLLLPLDVISLSTSLKSTLLMFAGLLLPLDAISFLPAWFKLYLSFLVATYSLIGPCIAKLLLAACSAKPERSLRGQYLSIRKVLFVMNTIRRTYGRTY